MKKTVKLDDDLWQKLMIAKVKEKKESINDVIRERVERYGHTKV